MSIIVFWYKTSGFGSQKEVQYTNSVAEQEYYIYSEIYHTVIVQKLSRNVIEVEQLCLENSQDKFVQSQWKQILPGEKSEV